MTCWLALMRGRPRCQWSVGSPRWRSVVFPAGGQLVVPNGGQIIPRPDLFEWFDPLSVGGLVEAEAVPGGDDDVRVVQQTVHGRGGEGFGHDLVEA